MHIDKNKGFTLAELVLAMAIVSILTAAMVPMLKHHKVRPREKFTPHGIVECYYKNGSLVMYRRDNDKYPNGKVENAGNSCVLSVPKANYYELHVIGAGGAGGGSGLDTDIYNKVINETGLIVLNEDEPISKTITVEQGFSGGEAAGKAAGIPSHILDIWAKSGITPKLRYTLTTFAGSGNYTSTSRRRNDETNDEGIFEKDVTVKYGSGTVGSITTVRPTITYNSIVETCTYPSVSAEYATALNIDGIDLIKVKASGPASGGTGGYECNGTIDSSCKNSITTIPSGKKNELNNSVATQGSFRDSDKGIINFKYPEIGLNYTYGKPGDIGEYSVTYYEKIRAEKMELYPAKDSSENSYVKIARSKKGDGKKLFETKKNPTERTDLIPYSTITEKDLPVPTDFLGNIETYIVPSYNDYKYKKFCSYEPKIKENDNGQAIGMCTYINSLSEEEQKKIIPGYGGYGGYPLVNNPGDLNLEVQIYGNGESARKTTGGATLTPKGASVTKCQYTNEAPTNAVSNGIGICKGTKGNPGAIILLW